MAHYGSDLDYYLGTHHSAITLWGDAWTRTDVPIPKPPEPSLHINSNKVSACTSGEHKA